ncbi:hypothetical protein [Ideonella oryzae]|uniref:hypothetical protein n=1 Tax=Ideonella oryzae TaxID=2937441 RepID=UPI00338D7ABC
MAQDLQANYPGMMGVSRSSLFAMRQFYACFSPQFQVVPQPVRQMLRGHMRRPADQGQVREAGTALRASLCRTWLEPHRAEAADRTTPSRAGRSYLDNPPQSAEALAQFAMPPASALREDPHGDHLMLYSAVDETAAAHLLSIRRPRQLSLDFARLWPGAGMPHSA